MSMNAYFSDKVKELSDFTSKRYKDDSGDNMRVGNDHLFSDRGRLYMILDENAVLSDELSGVVDEFSLYTSIPRSPHRETGIYRHESAEAEVEYEDYGKRQTYSTKIRGKKLEHCRDLLRMIKTGAIRPDESYEGEQNGMSRKELEAKFARACDRCKRVEEKLGRVIDLRNTLWHGFLWRCRWPWLTKRGAADLIEKALNS